MLQNLTYPSLNNVTFSQTDDQVVPVKDQKMAFLGRGMPKTQRPGPSHKEVLKARKRLQKRVQDFGAVDDGEDEIQEMDTDCDRQRADVDMN